jgi:hypothetical protein
MRVFFFVAWRGLTKCRVVSKPPDNSFLMFAVLDAWLDLLVRYNLLLQGSTVVAPDGEAVRN